MGTKYKPKTKKEIAAEVAALREIKPKVRQYSWFSEDNHEKIEAEIYVLENDLTEEKVWDRYQDPQYPEKLSGTLDAALYARRWKDGEEDGGLADDWKPAAGIKEDK